MTMICPYCNKFIDYTSIMGDSDWDDQQFDPYDAECPHCGKLIIITQDDVEVIRHFTIEEAEE